MCRSFLSEKLFFSSFAYKIAACIHLVFSLSLPFILHLVNIETTCLALNQGGVYVLVQFLEENNDLAIVHRKWITEDGCLSLPRIKDITRLLRRSNTRAWPEYGVLQHTTGMLQAFSITMFAF